jgi:hypothetical protein
MNTDYTQIEHDLCVVFGPKFVNCRITENPRATTYSFLHCILAERKDRRYLKGLFDGLVSFGIITRTEWIAIIDRFVKKNVGPKRKAPAR